MDERAKRIGDNESLFREVNERLIGLNAALEVDLDRIEFLCECGNADCTEKIALSKTEYEQVRSDATTFAVRPGHEILDVEHVVESKPAYSVVRKEPGGAAERAAAQDPRGG